MFRLKILQRRTRPVSPLCIPGNATGPLGYAHPNFTARQTDNTANRQTATGIRRCTAGLLASLIIFGSGCPNGPPTPPQPALLFTEIWTPWDLNIVRELQSGALSLDDPRIQGDLQRFPQCTFAADYNSSQQPLFQVNGQPGTPGFNVQLVSMNLTQAVGLSQACGTSQQINAVTIQPDQGIAIGALTRVGSAEFDLPDGSTFMTTSGVFEFTLTSLDQSSATASFRFVMMNSHDPHDQRVIVVIGSFSMPR